MADSAPFRIASGQGFWGDLARAPIDQARNGPIDVLVMDYLAEVTMSILQKQKLRDPALGYARDFVDVVVHVQHTEERGFYGLDRLWKDCPRVRFPEAEVPTDGATG